jgi:hypothetical protein
MAFGEGGAYWFDSIRSRIKGGDPDVFLEWAENIEKKSKDRCGDQAARIIFRGAVDEESKFSLDVDATDPDAIVCLLESIQGCLDLMPTVPKQFYGALMEAIVFQAQEKGTLDGPWHF